MLKNNYKERSCFEHHSVGMNFYPSYFIGIEGSYWHTRDSGIGIKVHLFSTSCKNHIVKLDALNFVDFHSTDLLIIFLY